jgi:hypothetical protein
MAGPSLSKVVTRETAKQEPYTTSQIVCVILIFLSNKRCFITNTAHKNFAQRE